MIMSLHDRSLGRSNCPRPFPRLVCFATYPNNIALTSSKSHPTKETGKPRPFETQHQGNFNCTMLCYCSRPLCLAPLLTFVCKPCMPIYCFRLLHIRRKSCSAELIPFEFATVSTGVLFGFVQSSSCGCFHHKIR